MLGGDKTPDSRSNLHTRIVPCGLLIHMLIMSRLTVGAITMERNTKVALILILLLALVGIVQYPSFVSSLTSTLNVSSFATITNMFTSSRGDSIPVESVPTMNATQIDTLLCSAHSSACGTGNALYSDSLASGINDSFAVAIFREESNYGTSGIARSNLGLGNIRCSHGYTCKYGYRAYANWQAGYTDFYALISYYVHTLKLATVEQIIPVYAPSSENNTSLYISNVEQFMSKYQQAGK